VRTGRPEALRQRAAELVVEVEHGGFQARGLEQPRLCIGVGLHRTVVIEMIVREIGEQGAASARRSRGLARGRATRLPSTPPARRLCAIPASVRCSSSASGVVFGEALSAPAKALPSVPITPHFSPRCSSAAAIHWLHEVLPSSR